MLTNNIFSYQVQSPVDYHSIAFIGLKILRSQLYSIHLQHKVDEQSTFYIVSSFLSEQKSLD